MKKYKKKRKKIYLILFFSRIFALVFVQRNQIRKTNRAIINGILVIIFDG